MIRPEHLRPRRHEETDTQTAILQWLATQQSYLRVWRNNCGRAGRVLFGVPGQADISGLLLGGRRLEIEVKSRRGVQSKEQIAFKGMIESMGGLYVLARSVDDVKNALLEYFDE